MKKYTSFQGKRVYLLILSLSQYIATEALKKEKNAKIIRFSFSHLGSPNRPRPPHC